MCPSHRAPEAINLDNSPRRTREFLDRVPGAGPPYYHRAFEDAVGQWHLLPLRIPRLVPALLSWARPSIRRVGKQPAEPLRSLGTPSKVTEILRGDDSIPSLPDVLMLTPS